jgi:hypothetical protein
VSLTFDSDRHRYYWCGKRVPGVTGILELAQSFGFVDYDTLVAAQDRGTYVHKLCELDDLDDLHPDEETGTHAGYLTAWRSFCRDYGANWEGIEERGYSQMFQVAGTLDRRGTLERKFPATLKWIVDVKTSKQHHNVWGMQLAAYRQIVAERLAGWALARRASVQLREDGKYLFKPWDNPLDWPAFQALITLTHWKQHA